MRDSVIGIVSVHQKQTKAQLFSDDKVAMIERRLFSRSLLFCSVKISLLFVHFRNTEECLVTESHFPAV